jgi:hypothetical protein
MSKKARTAPPAGGHGSRDWKLGSYNPQHTQTAAGKQAEVPASADPAPDGGRHRCRNRRCRERLPEPVDNPRRAFCCRGCFNSFYRSRCRVCEAAIRRKNEQQRTCIAYTWPEKQITRDPPPDDGGPPKNADFIGSKPCLRPHHRCLREWSWGGDGDRDHSLYDRDGLTIARVVLGGDGRYHLRAPIAVPRQAWAHLEEAKRGAESFALMAIPLAAVDPRLAARIKRDNETPHPMGPPLNRPPLTSDATLSDWQPTGNGADVLDIPACLKRGAL